MKITVVILVSATILLSVRPKFSPKQLTYCIRAINAFPAKQTNNLAIARLAPCELNYRNVFQFQVEAYVYFSLK